MASFESIEAHLLNRFTNPGRFLAPPDPLALTALRDLYAKWPRAAGYVVEELDANRGNQPMVHDGQEVDFFPASGRSCDEQGLPVFELVRKGHQGPFNTSAAIMKAVTRWNGRLAELRQSTMAPPLPKRPRQDDDHDGARLPQTSIFFGSQELLGGSQALAEVSAAERAAQMATFKEVMNGNQVPYDLHFRLLAAGADIKFQGQRGQLTAKVHELRKVHAKWTSGKLGQAEAFAKMNAIGAEYGLSLGYVVPGPHSTTIYQVTILLDGTVRYDPPLEAGRCLAHRRLKRLLLRVRFEPLQGGRPSAAAKERREGLRRATVLNGLPDVAGKRFVHFCHKDADKGEGKGAALWFFRVVDSYKMTPEVSVRNHRELLLDTLAYTDGKALGQTNGKRLSVAKLNARLCLAFSASVNVERCRPTSEDGIIDFRGVQISRDALLQKLYGLGPTEEGEVRLVQIDDLVGRLPDGTPSTDPKGELRIMTDGAGLISHNLARHIPKCASGRLVDEEATAGCEIPLLTQASASSCV